MVWKQLSPAEREECYSLRLAGFRVLGLMFLVLFTVILRTETRLREC